MLGKMTRMGESKPGPKRGTNLGEKKEHDPATEAYGGPVALTIAGFDPSSGAGITADLQVFAAHGLFGTSAITALTAQSTLGVAAVQPVDSGFLAKTLENLDADLPAHGIKIGMLGSEEGVRVVTAFLQDRARQGRRGLVVLDPVLRSSSGQTLLPEAALKTLQSELLPLVDWITPNRAELATLTGHPSTSIGEARGAMDSLGRRYPHLCVVATGGDDPEGQGAHPTAVDLLRTPDGTVEEFSGPLIKTSSTHGTGCAFSSALLARLMLGESPRQAVAGAKAYVAEALRSAPGIGHGRGPLGLLWPLRKGSGERSI